MASKKSTGSKKAKSEAQGSTAVAVAPEAPKKTGKYRLVTRSDFDGLVCAVLLKDRDLIDDILFVHPKDMQDGKIPITDNDITTNLPYVAAAHLVFDHHLSETIRNTEGLPNHVIDPNAPSAARVVYNHYGGKAAFPHISDEMMQAVDKADAARYSMKDILNAQGWELLSFIMDARTGLGRFRDFTVSNYQLMMELIDHCKEQPIEEILELPNVKERVDLYHKHDHEHKMQIKNCSKVYDNCVVIDLREEPVIYAGNRFTVYASFLQCNISIQVMWGREKQNTVFAIGKSIINKTGSGARVNIGEICLKHGGGGHMNAGTCQIDNDRANEVLGELVEAVTGRKHNVAV